MFSILTLCKTKMSNIQIRHVKPNPCILTLTICPTYVSESPTTCHVLKELKCIRQSPIIIPFLLFQLFDSIELSILCKLECRVVVAVEETGSPCRRRSLITEEKLMKVYYGGDENFS